MTLVIENEEADRLAHELARVRGESVDEVVVKALKEKLERETQLAKTEAQLTEPDDVEAFVERIREIGRRHSALPILDPRSDDEILGYDDHGLPR